MGFWQTGYSEFHEEVGLERTDPPSPPVYHCPRCEATFTIPEDLYRHQYEKHPHNRPVLFLRGREAGITPLRITRPITASDVSFDHCMYARINGETIPLAKLAASLAKKTDDTVTVELSNDDVSAKFPIRFEIASATDLQGIERCFLNVARKGQFDKRAVEDFITESRSFSTAAGYCDGVCEYLYGVLAKERSSDSSLPYKVYQEKFTRAADTLKDFDRPLASAIGALIAFHFNHFSDCRSLANKSRVGIAAGRFECWMVGDIPGAQNLLSLMFDDRLEKLLTDSETERLILWSTTVLETSPHVLEDIESIIRQDIPNFDKAKLHILLAEFYAQRGNVAGAKRHAGELRNSPTLGPWAEQLLRRLAEKE